MAYTIFLAINKKRPTHFEPRIRRSWSPLKIFYRELLSTTQQIMGKVSRVKILANEPILESRLAGEGAGLTVRLEAGKRALALRVDEIIGVSGFIVPDDRVDIILTTTPLGAVQD